MLKLIISMAGANSSFTSGVTTFINSSNVSAIWVSDNQIIIPSGMVPTQKFSFGWGTGSLVCINTLLYLDFSIE